MSATPGQRAAVKRAITRFENAVYENAFKGTIPAGESDEAAAAYAAVEHEYSRARICLMRLLDRLL
jgi:hypothetical protein